MEKSIVIDIRNLSKEYILRAVNGDSSSSRLSVIENLNLTIYKGDCIGIIGPNGSGKSTLLKLLSGITKPTSGEIEIHGRVASILDIGAGFHPELTGSDNIYLHGQIMGFKRQEIEKNFQSIVSFSGIEKFIQQPVKNYSNGMYLRLAFSIMVHLDFDIYLIDEVFNVGDQEFQQRANEKLQSLVESKTILITSHDWNSLNRLVSQVVYMTNGATKLFDSFSNFSKFIIQNTERTKTNDSYHINSDDQFSNNSFKVEVLNFEQTNGFVSFCLTLDSMVCPFHIAVSVKDTFSNTIIEYYIKDKFENSYAECRVRFPIDFYNEGNYQIDIILFDIETVIGIKRQVVDFSVLHKSYPNLFERKRWGICRSSIELDVLFSR